VIARFAVVGMEYQLAGFASGHLAEKIDIGDYIAHAQPPFPQFH
jgi:hypothetical protein